ncbi:MAG: SpoIIE family protein phosphatase [Bacteroidetes bacterium]|nr:SpoIIE family protein phosphatase [Bacteroidota bacterium]
MVALDIQEQILDKLNTLIVVLNNDGSVDYVSKSARQLLGYEPDDLLGNNWWIATRFSKPEGIEVKRKLQSIFKNRNSGVQTFEHLLKTSQGGQKWINWNVSVLNEEQLVGIGYDITEKKLNEKRLIESNKRLSEQNKDITDSIRYAKRIQESILQSKESVKSILEESFLLYKPKDIVSGDFYWFYENENYKYVAAVDCTGHGVPGAMMSMVANSIFKEVFLNRKEMETDKILYALDEELEKAIHKNQTESFNDGMDVALIRIDKSRNELQFSGALRPLFISDSSGVSEIRGSRYPLGFYPEVKKNFEKAIIHYDKGTCIYLGSDGFADQFGGLRGKKMNRVNFKELLKTAFEMPIEEQEAFLEYSFNNWKQQEEQTDDVLMIGIKL